MVTGTKCTFFAKDRLAAINLLFIKYFLRIIRSNVTRLDRAFFSTDKAALPSLARSLQFIITRFTQAMKAVTQFKDWLQFIVGTGKKTNGTILANIEVRKVLRSSASPRSEKKRRAKTEVFGLDLADTTTSSDDGVKVLFDLHFVSNKHKKGRDSSTPSLLR